MGFGIAAAYCYRKLKTGKHPGVATHILYWFTGFPEPKELPGSHIRELNGETARTVAPDKANNEREALKAQIRFHRMMNVGLLGTLFFSVLLLGFVLLRDNIKIVPPEVRRPYEIGAHYANRDYLLDMAGYVLSMVLSVTPETVD